MDAKTANSLRAIGLNPDKLPPGTKVNGKPLADLDAGKATNLFAPYKNKWEWRWAQQLEERKQTGIIEWWAYEPVTLVIVDAGGKRCRYTPDFLTFAYGRIVFDEVKGFMREAARIRFLAAKERYPFWTFRLVRWIDGRWEVMDTP